MGIEKEASSCSRAGCLVLVALIAGGWIYGSCEDARRYREDPEYRAQVDAQRAKEQAERAAEKARREEQKRIEAAEGRGDHAHAMAQKFVRKQLRSPSTASFCNYFISEAGVGTDRLGGGRWRCVGYCDSQNALGATVRTRYDVTVQFQGGNRWTMVSIQVW